MTICTFRGMLIVLLSALVVSCDGEEPIDNDYLDSRQYQQFKEKQEQEYAEYIDDYESLKKLLSAFGKCKLGKKWSYPIQFDDQVLRYDNIPCEAVSIKYNSDFSFYLVGYSEFDDITIRWIKINKESGYKNIELLAATYRADSLINFKSVGVFQENLSKSITTNISVGNHGEYLSIHSTMNRSIKYPVAYDNVIQSTFRIDLLGIIKNKGAEVNTDQQLPEYLKALNNCKMGKDGGYPYN